MHREERFQNLDYTRNDFDSKYLFFQSVKECSHADLMTASGFIKFFLERIDVQSVALVARSAGLCRYRSYPGKHPGPCPAETAQS